MELLKNTIEIGLEKPVKLLHVTDTHLTLTDERDDERKRELGANRTKSFGNENGRAEKTLEAQLAYARENCDLLVHTGDLIDFISAPNIEKTREFVKNENVFFIAGNHEYSRYVGEAWEDKNYRMNSYMQMGYGVGVPMFFNSRVAGGVNVVGIDNSYYLFEDWQIARLKREVAKGLPVVLVFHDPIFEKSLYDYHKAMPGADCTYLVGVDEDRLADYSEFRAVQQRPDEATLRAVEYIESEPMIKLVLAGHLHFNFESMLTPDLPQFVTDCSTRCAREITLV